MFSVRNLFSIFTLVFGVLCVANLGLRDHYVTSKSEQYHLDISTLANATVAQERFIIQAVELETGLSIYRGFNKDINKYILFTMRSDTQSDSYDISYYHGRIGGFILTKSKPFKKEFLSSSYAFRTQKQEEANYSNEILRKTTLSQLPASILKGNEAKFDTFFANNSDRILLQEAMDSHYQIQIMKKKGTLGYVIHSSVNKNTPFLFWI